MPSATLHFTQTYTLVTCAGCHMAFAIDNAFERKRRDDHKTFYCPSGHTNYYPDKSEAELQRERAERLQAALKRREADLQNERRSHSATKGALTKTRKRANHAMCPVDGCHRSFANVARHIANQHPDYTA